MTARGFLAMKGPKPEPLAADSGFQQTGVWDIQVPFLAEGRKLYEFCKQ